MNVLDAYVTEIHGKPYQMYGRWWVSVTSDCEGRPTTGPLMFNSEEEALAVKIGHHHLV